MADVQKTRWQTPTLVVGTLIIIVVAIILWRQYKKKKDAEAAAAANGNPTHLAIPTTNAGGQNAVLLAPIQNTDAATITPLMQGNIQAQPPVVLNTATNTTGSFVAQPPVQRAQLGNGIIQSGGAGSANLAAAGLSLGISATGQTIGRPVYRAGGSTVGLIP